MYLGPHLIDMMELFPTAVDDSTISKLQVLLRNFGILSNICDKGFAKKCLRIKAVNYFHKKLHGR